MVAANRQWGSRGAFLLASIGFAVGLGNIWRFPYVTGENGGSAFVIIYLACAFVIGVPILMAELLVGRRGGMAPVRAVANVALEGGLSQRWAGIGYLNQLTAFSIMTVYAVVAGWVLYYFFLALNGAVAAQTGADAAATFDALLASPTRLGLWSFIALSLTGLILSAGLEKGIERAVKVLMPTLFALLLMLMIYNVFAGGMPEAIQYLFQPDFSKVGPDTFLAALGQAFFSIGVAMAGMMIFGAYLPKEISIARSALIIVAADTAVALVAGLVIFPMVFHGGLDPAQGSGLIFNTLPLAFAQMSGGPWVAIAFFLLLSVAAVTSMVGLTEPMVSMAEERLSLGRRRATALVCGLIMAVSLISALSYNFWAGVLIGSQTLNHWLDYLPNQIFLPLGGLLIALFVAWRLPANISADELAVGSERWFSIWYRSIRFLVVPAVLLILVTGI